jgi:Arc/MetJ-type ribon-helix-helix transcriptional regulator
MKRGYRYIQVSLPPELVKLVDKLIEKGEYRNRSDFLSEAMRSHLRTWYPETLE